MERFLVIAFLLMTGMIGTQEKTVVTVVVRKIENEKGMIGVALYNKSEDFMKKHVDTRQVKAKKGEVTVTFDDLPPGDYAITVIHDENENKKLDTNGIGMPKEGFGFSNDAMGMFGPPSFEKAKFTCDGKPKTITINLKHM